MPLCRQGLWARWLAPCPSSVCGPHPTCRTPFLLGQPGSCRPAGLSLGRVPGPRPGRPGLYGPLSPSARGGHLLGSSFVPRCTLSTLPDSLGNPADHCPEPVSEKPHTHVGKGGITPPPPGQAASSCAVGSTKQAGRGSPRRAPAGHSLTPPCSHAVSQAHRCPHELRV